MKMHRPDDPLVMQTEKPEETDECVNASKNNDKNNFHHDINDFLDFMENDDDDNVSDELDFTLDPYSNERKRSHAALIERVQNISKTNFLDLYLQNSCQKLLWKKRDWLIDRDF